MIPNIWGCDLTETISNNTIKNFLVNSKCATDNYQKLYLNLLLGNKTILTTLLYRGTTTGWSALEFHQRCDYNLFPTISLFKIKDGDCIGGYTTVQWTSQMAGGFMKDDTATLFNLSKCRQFASK